MQKKSMCLSNNFDARCKENFSLYNFILLFFGCNFLKYERVNSSKNHVTTCCIMNMRDLLRKDPLYSPLFTDPCSLA